jgi:hypothetical protein
MVFDTAVSFFQSADFDDVFFLRMPTMEVLGQVPTLQYSFFFVSDRDQIS